MTNLPTPTINHIPYMPAIEWVTAGPRAPEMPPTYSGRIGERLNSTISAGDNVVIIRSEAFGCHFSKLRAIQAEPDLWPEGADGPNDEAIALAAQVLERLENDMVVPSRVVATAEGGVAICFVKGDAYADVECFNDGVILGATTNGRDRPVVWEIEPRSGGIAWASDRIRKFLLSQTPGKNGPGKPSH